MDWSAAGTERGGHVEPLRTIRDRNAPMASMLGAAVLEDLAFAIHGNRLALNSVQPAEGPIRLTGGYAEAPAVGQNPGERDRFGGVLVSEVGPRRRGVRRWPGAADDFGGMPDAAEALAPDRCLV